MYDINFVKKRLIVSMGAILLLVVVLIGITYAYFVSSVRGNTNDKSIGVSSGRLELTYSDGNGLITANLIQPGTVLNTKTFTVENTGTAIVHDYSVIIEDVVNELERYEDLTYILTCESSVGTCNGNNGVFPNNNEILITNDIDKDVVHTYSLIVTYNETSVDQSVDMNKSISAKVNIFDETNTITELVASGNTYQSNLPYPYQEVEYIENRNNEYINTGFTPNQDTKVETKIYLISSSTFFGARTTYNTNAFAVGTDSNMKLSVTYGTEVYTTTDVLSLNTPYVAKLYKNNFYLDDVLLNTFTTQTFTPNVNLYLFAYNSNGSLAKSGAKRIYYTKIWDNDVLVRDMIPCYNIETNEIGMYDKANDVFYTNAGTGTFLKGNDIGPTPTEPIEVLGLGENSRNMFDETKYDDLDEYIVEGNAYSYAVIQLKPLTTYKISVNRSNGFDGKGKGYLLFSLGKTINGLDWSSIVHESHPNESYTNYIYTTQNDGILYIGYYIASMTQERLSYIWDNTDVQIEEGSVATEYRPYKYVDVVSTGKNLLKPQVNIPLTNGNLVLSNYNNGVYGLNGSSSNAYRFYSYNDIPIKAHEVYYATFNLLEGEILSDVGLNIVFHYIDSAGTELRYPIGFITGNTSKTLKKRIVFENDVTIKSWSFWTYSNERLTTINNAKIQVQLEKSNDATEYYPYQAPITTTIDLAGHEPLRKIGDVSDYIDYRNKKIIRNIVKKELNGMETFGIYKGGYYTSFGNTKYYRPIGVSTHFKYNSGSDVSNPLGLFYFNGTVTPGGWNGNVTFGYDNGSGGINNFKTWLATQKMNRTPVTIFYQLKDPVEESIDFELSPTVGSTITIKDDMLTASNAEVQIDS